MHIKTVWSVWFSGTGTTKKAVTILANGLAETLGVQRKDFSFNRPDARQQTLTFGPEDLVVLGVPVYAGRVPNLLLPWLQNNLHGENTPALPMVLYGNRHFDDGLIELRDVLAANGFCPLGAAAIVGQHAFSETLGKGRPDAADMALLEQLEQQVAHKVQTLAAPPFLPVPVEGCSPIRPYYIPRDRHGEPIRDFLKAKPATLFDRCLQCGACAAVCPMGSIQPEAPFQVTGKCIKCNACIKTCPAGAKVFDHEGYLYHKQELEEQYGGRRAESKIFF